MSKYEDMSPQEQEEFIRKHYLQENRSFPEVAGIGQTYVNKLRRDAVKFKIPLRSRSDAQKLIFGAGKRESPTKGKTRTDEEKIKISESRAKSWSKLTTAERARLSKIAKDQWDNMTEDEKQQFWKKAGEAVRQASKEGSKLEKYLLQELIGAGYRVDFHKEHLVVNERLQLDMLLPKLNVVIEVDGPSHFLPIWGQKTLNRNVQSDSTKAGLLLAQGYVLIRVKQDKPLSEKFKRDTFKALHEVLTKIETNFPKSGERLIEL